MNATRRRTMAKRYPKRIEEEVRFERYMKSFLKDLSISC